MQLSPFQMGSCCSFPLKGPGGASLELEQAAVRPLQPGQPSRRMRSLPNHHSSANSAGARLCMDHGQFSCPRGQNLLAANYSDFPVSNSKLQRNPQILHGLAQSAHIPILCRAGIGVCQGLEPNTFATSAILHSCVMKGTYAAECPDVADLVSTRSLARVTFAPLT